jgi:RNA ligase
MNYTFPVINTIDDVLPHIKNYEEIVVSENVQGNYLTIRYMISTPNLWEWNESDTLGCAIRRECRGIAFEVKTGEVISRPYHKFFNVNEKPETQINKINLYESHMILEKLDGSMIRPIKCSDGDFYIATKAGESEVSAQASNWLRDHDNYYDFMNYCIKMNSTPIFEWASRKNRIVIDYPEDRLVLTAIRGNHDGIYLSYNALVWYSQTYGIDYVKAVNSLSVQNINLLHNQVKEWEDAEGVVIRFDTGHMLKIKADDYILRHHAKESINHEKNLIALILSDGLDDLLPVLHENDQKRVSDFEKAFHASIHDTAMNIHDMYGEYVRNYALSDKKDFAVNFALKKDKKYQQFLFGLHRGDYNLLEALYKTIENNLSSSSRVENVRWIFGGIRF